jgi:hypothetical protein
VKGISRTLRIPSATTDQEFNGWPLAERDLLIGEPERRTNERKCLKLVRLGATLNEPFAQPVRQRDPAPRAPGARRQGDWQTVIAPAPDLFGPAAIASAALCGGDGKHSAVASGCAGTWSSTAPNVRTRAHPGVAGVAWIGGDADPRTICLSIRAGLIR